MYSVKSGLRKALYMYSATPFSRFENEECSSCFALRGMHFLGMFVSRFTGRMSSAELFIICVQISMQFTNCTTLEPLFHDPCGSYGPYESCCPG